MNYYVGVYDSANGWTTLLGPACFYDNSLSFTALPIATTFTAGTTYTYVVFSTSAQLATPCPVASFLQMYAPANGATGVEMNVGSTVALSVTPMPGAGTLPAFLSPVSLVAVTAGGTTTFLRGPLTFGIAGYSGAGYTGTMPFLPASTTFSVLPAGSACAIGSFSRGKTSTRALSRHFSGRPTFSITFLIQAIGGGS